MECGLYTLLHRALLFGRNSGGNKRAMFLVSQAAGQFARWLARILLFVRATRAHACNPAAQREREK
jgi:hypothetical protein